MRVEMAGMSHEGRCLSASDRSGGDEVEPLQEDVPRLTPVSTPDCEIEVNHRRRRRRRAVKRADKTAALRCEQPRGRRPRDLSTHSASASRVTTMDGVRRQSLRTRGDASRRSRGVGTNRRFKTLSLLHNYNVPLTGA